MFQKFSSTHVSPSDRFISSPRSPLSSSPHLPLLMCVFLRTRPFRFPISFRHYLKGASKSDPRHKQTLVDTSRHYQTLLDTIRHYQTLLDTSKHQQTLTTMTTETAIQIQSRAGSSRVEQSRAEQSRVEQRRADQSSQRVTWAAFTILAFSK